MGPEIAEYLDYPQVTYGLEAEVDGNTVKIKKECGDGIEIVGIQMPCVVTFTKPSWDPRYPTIKRKMAANRAEIPTANGAQSNQTIASYIGTPQSGNILSVWGGDGGSNDLPTGRITMNSGTVGYIHGGTLSRIIVF